MTLPTRNAAICAAFNTADANSTFATTGTSRSASGGRGKPSCGASSSVSPTRMATSIGDPNFKIKWVEHASTSSMVATCTRLCGPVKEVQSVANSRITRSIKRSSITESPTFGAGLFSLKAYAAKRRACSSLNNKIALRSLASIENAMEPRMTCGSKSIAPRLGSEPRARTSRPKSSVRRCEAAPANASTRSRAIDKRGSKTTRWTFGLSSSGSRNTRSSAIT